MLWQGRRQSSNIEDRRGVGGRSLAVGGGLGTMIIAAIIYLLGGNPDQVLNGDASAPSAQQTTGINQADDTTSQFVAVVLADTEDVWSKLFNDRNKQYSKPVLVMFTRSTESGCGFASEASGPFIARPIQKFILICLSSRK